MGFAWIQPSSGYSYEGFATIPSAPLKAEFLVLATAIFVCPPGCQVSIFSDCSTLIDLMMKASAEFFLNVYNITKSPQHNLLLTIYNLIRSKGLRIQWHKVQSHADNPWNNAVDSLAKQALRSRSSNSFSTFRQHSQFYLPLWNNI